MCLSCVNLRVLVYLYEQFLSMCECHSYVPVSISDILYEWEFSVVSMCMCEHVYVFHMHLCKQSEIFL